MDISLLPSYREVLELLDSYTNLERNAIAPGHLSGGLERMAELMHRLGSPHAAIPTIHIAGTKGKGSTAHMTAAALAAAGIKTGLYTSPHVDSLRERIMVNGRSIGEQRFVESCMTVLREAEAMNQEGIPPSYFEILTATALTAFAACKVDAMVLETGLGGRLDATNLPDLNLVAAGITDISMDHQQVLGDTLAAIAAEKAAIIRKGVPVVTTTQEPSAMRVVMEQAKNMRAPVFAVGKDIQVSVRRPASAEKPTQGQRVDLETWRNVYPDVAIAMFGEHQAANAAVALGLTDLFLEYMDREPLDSLVLKRAWRSLALPGRLELAGTAPWHVVDGAHNPASAWAAAETLRQSFPVQNRVLIFGVAADKEWRTMLKILAPLFRAVVVTPYDSDRAAPVEELARFVNDEIPQCKTLVAIDPAHALELAREAVDGVELILTTGSLYLAGEMRRLCRAAKSSRK